MKVLLFTLMVAFLSSSSTHAEDGPLVKAYKEKTRIEAGSYALTKKLCTVPDSFMKQIKFLLNVEINRDRVALKGMKTAILDPLDSGQITSSTLIFLDSPGYWKAMSECFGSDSSAMLAFSTDIVLADLEGRGAGLIGFWYLGVGEAFQFGQGVLVARGVLSASAATTITTGASYASYSLPALIIAKTLYKRHILGTSGGLDDELDKTSRSVDTKTNSIVKMRLQEVDEELKAGALSADQRKDQLAYREELIEKLNQPTP